jgi:2-amino-4-hydroxy-6-hydroxymethyldihydropteridine diphosphokinase
MPEAGTEPGMPVPPQAVSAAAECAVPPARADAVADADAAADATAAATAAATAGAATQQASNSAPGARRVYVGMGANQGDILATLRSAIEALGSIERTSLAAVSPFYRSAPIGAGGGDFINAVAALDTELDPYALLLHLADLELHLGRKRRTGDAPHGAPRNIDLDLLLVGHLILRSTPLVLPHPRIQQRAFVLRPLADLDPDLHVPGHGPISALLGRVADQDISRIESP